MIFLKKSNKNHGEAEKYMQKEIEVKFKTDEINDIKELLINLGASFEEL